MSIFGARKVRGLEEPILPDPNDTIVHEIRELYPFANEAFAVRSLIRLVVFTALEMKKRGLL